MALARRGLSGRARLAVDGHDGALRLRGSQRVALERPARLRVEVLGLFDQTLAVLVTDGERYQFFRANDRTWESGPVGPDLLWTHAWRSGRSVFQVNRDVWALRCNQCNQCAPCLVVQPGSHNCYGNV